MCARPCGEWRETALGLLGRGGRLESKRERGTGALGGGFVVRQGKGGVGSGEDGGDSLPERREKKETKFMRRGQPPGTGQISWFPYPTSPLARYLIFLPPPAAPVRAAHFPGFSRGKKEEGKR